MLRFYFIRQALLNMKRNLTVHILSVGTIMASLLILAAFLLLFWNLNNWLRQWGSALSMTVYLKDDISAYKRDKIDAFIRTLPGAKAVRFISKEDALNEMRAVLREEAGILKQLTHNPLPASYEFVIEGRKLESAEVDEIKRQLESMDGVQEIQHSQQWLKKIEGFLGVASLIGYIVGGLLCMCVVFIVTNTIKLTIHSRRDEIEILKLVGATDWFVKFPFLLEGTLEGLIGGAAAILAIFLGYLALSTREVYLIGVAPLSFAFLPATYVVLTLCLSAAMGVLGSLIAVGRFFNLR